MSSSGLMRSAMLAVCSAAVAVCLSACGGPAKPRPTELQTLTSLLDIKKSWGSNIGDVSFPLDVRVMATDVVVASGGGLVQRLDAQTGNIRWALELGDRISAGVGADGDKAAVVTAGGELVAIDNGKVLWRQRLGAVAVTSPLVAGGRVFVVTPDRTIIAFDASNGKRLWQQQRGGDALVLDKAGVLMPVGDTLIVGVGGRLLGLNPLNGAQRWEMPVAVSRGTNEVERLVDIVAGVSRVGAEVCVRSYSYSVACVNTASTKINWSKNANGFTGLAGDEKFVFGTEADGRIVAWRRADGERVWQSDVYKWRELGTPLVLGGSLAVPDAAGFVHVVSKADGASLTRLALDGSPLAAAPVAAGNNLVLVTQKGGVYAFRPE